jgi:CPA1 family monovalent cation:H+ antiporter
MDYFIANSVSLLCVAVVVAIVTRRLKLPYTVGLVVTGMALAFAHIQTGLELTHDFIFEVVLPALLFEASLTLRISDLRRDGLPIAVMTTVGVFISAACVAGGLIFFLKWPLMPATIFGVLIAATDPVAVIAMFKDIGLRGRVRLLVEAESLFNDGIAAVLFAVCMAWAQDGAVAFSIKSAGTTLFSIAGGGILCGLACGGAAIALMGRVDDYLIETTVTTVTAYGAFMLAERLHFSGVVATVSAGLLIGNFGLLKDVPDKAPSVGREFVVSFWNLAAFIANSLVFLLIGIAVAGIEFRTVGTYGVVVTILLTLIARALAVYPLFAVLGRTRWAIPVANQHVLWWGGLRGALGLALALALPAKLDHRTDILILAFAVVAFSILVQGLTMPWLLRATGLRVAHE